MYSKNISKFKMDLTLTVFFFALSFVSSAHGQNARTGSFNASDFVIDIRNVRTENTGNGGYIRPVNVHKYNLCRLLSSL